MTTSNRRPAGGFRTPFIAGTATAAGLHTLLITVTGMLPQPGDDLKLWSTYFVYVSAVPVFVIVVIGLILAPSRSRLGAAGMGLVLGAVAAPPLWLLAAELAFG